MANAEAPRLLSALLVRSRAAALIACGLESCLLFATAGLLCLTAAALDGQDLEQIGARGAAALAGALAALAWWLERRPTRLGLVRRVDRSLGRGGGLVTAWECAGNDEVRRLEIPRALIQSELAGLSSSGAMRAGLPRSGALVCAPLLAGALLASVLEGDARSSSPPTPPGNLGYARAWSWEPATEATSVEEIPPVTQALPGVGPGGEAPESRTEEPDRREDEASRVPDPDALPGVVEEQGESGPGREPLAESPGEGQRDGGPGSSSSPQEAGESGVSSEAFEAGLVGGRWWPRRYDDLVAGWIEARRALAELAGENPR